MISVGIDVSKGKSTVCSMRHDGEIVLRARDFEHTKTDLAKPTEKIRFFNEDIKIIMKVTGGYRNPILDYFIREGYVGNGRECTSHEETNCRRIPLFKDR